MRRFALTWLVLLAALLLCGMGGLGGEPEGTLPDTEHDFSVSVIDRSGVETALSRFSMDGSTFFHGQLGAASVTIAFEDVRSASFKSLANDRIKVVLELKEGRDLTLLIRRRSGFAGQMEVGVFHIRAEDVSRVDFK
ncbi:MAG: hypothetical protein C0624_07530 [Desulfuromonas sp.]|nr:MAG: hypothetical protein C0624_07530 [Desulfuromonas sp.]